jgi:hypothetical protein
VTALGVGGALRYAHRPADAPPPPPDLSFLSPQPDPPAEPQATAETEGGPSLSEAERSLIWDIEHHGNLLNRYGFKPLANALRDADADALAALFAEGEAFRLPREPREVSTHSECLSVVRREDTGTAPRVVGPGPFVARLLEYRREFKDKAPGVQLFLKTVHPRVRTDLDGPWEGEAFLRLWGESRPGQPCEVLVNLTYEVDRPTRERLTQPAWFRAAAVKQELVAHASRYLMGDVARQRGLDPSLFHDNWLEDPSSQASLWISSGGVFVCDYNRDGILDILITDLNRYALYRGTADGRFVDVTAEVGLPRDPTNASAVSGVACWIDIDGDGWDDLILGGRVFRNDGGTHFVDVTPQARLRLPPDTNGLTVADYDRDGRLDLYATRTGSGTARSWLDGQSGPDAGNRLFRNLGNWQFEDVTRAAGAAGGRRSTFTAAWLDANNDGWPDLFVTNEFGNGVLLVNNGDGTFREQALGPGPVDFGTMGVAAGDVDNDGNIDLYCADMYSKAGTRVISNIPPGVYPDEMMATIRRFVAGSQLHLNRGGLKFEQAGTALKVNSVGWAYGPALADLDNDGWLDVFGTAGHMSRDRDKPDG